MWITVRYGIKTLKLSYNANGAYTILTIIGVVYKDTVYPLIQVLLFAYILDRLTTSQIQSFSDLSIPLAIFLTTSLLNVIFTSYDDTKKDYYGMKLESYIDFLISQKLTQLDPATFEKSDFQDLMAQIEGIKANVVANVFKFTQLISVIVKFLTAAIILSAFLPFIIPVILVATIPSYYFLNRYRINTWDFWTVKRSRLVRVTQYIKTLLSSDSTSKEAKIFKTGPILLSKMKIQQDSHFSAMDKAINPELDNVIFARFFQFAAFIYTQYLNLSAVMVGILSIGQFALYFQQTLNLTQGAESILNQYSSMAMRNENLGKFFAFLTMKPEIISGAVINKSFKDSLPPKIEFKNVSFHYPGNKRNILSNFNLTITSGEKIALVGENGAGKTSLIKLLLRFYDVTEGEILLNGINIKEIDLEEWHKQIGALFQDFIKYQFTFKENVYFGDLAKEQKEALLKEAINKSGANTYVDQLPKKYEQIVGKMFDGGVDLSGGQWQKLALARAFYRNAPILILDEPTSAIDAKAESEIFENVQKLQKDKTVIIISHRFSTVRNADRILVLDDGRIVEEGSHEILMKKKGLYEELFTLQAKGYK